MLLPLHEDQLSAALLWDFVRHDDRMYLPTVSIRFGLPFPSKSFTSTPDDIVRCAIVADYKYVIWNSVT